MKITFYWKETQPVDELKLIAHPQNKQDVLTLEKALETIEPQIHVIDPKNNRKSFLSLNKIETIQAFGHLCQLLTITGEPFLIQKRLKAVLEMNFPYLVQINNSTILNLNHVVSFESGQNARLEVHTQKNNHYVVSRHYAKLIKEKLS